MGSKVTKSKVDGTIPVAQITIKRLTCTPTHLNQPKKSYFVPQMHNKLNKTNPLNVPILSTWLCGSLLKTSTRDDMCTESDVENLIIYLGSEMNLSRYDVSKQMFSRRKHLYKYDLDTFRLEQEVVQILNKDKYPHKRLSYGANKHLENTLKQLDSKSVLSKFSVMLIHLRFKTFNKPRLLEEIIIPKLEEAYSINVNRSSYDKIIIYSFKEKYSDFKIRFDDIFIRKKLSASNLRRNPSIKSPTGLSSAPGMDRAHKLSLFLAVQLWKKVYGHDLAYDNVRVQLSQALSLSSNLYHTCHHTNRVLHVRYDKEIVEALQAPGAKNLTPGAKMRIKQVLDVMSILKKDSTVMSDFSKRSIPVLKELI